MLLALVRQDDSEKNRSVRDWDVKGKIEINLEKDFFDHKYLYVDNRLTHKSVRSRIFKCDELLLL